LRIGSLGNKPGTLALLSINREIGEDHEASSNKRARIGCLSFSRFRTFALSRSFL
jgi:hypothetical protein